MEALSSSAQTTATQHSVTEQRLVDVQDVARIMGISAKGVRRQVDAGQLPGVIRVGRLIRFDVQVIHSWISAGCPPLREWNAQVRRRL